jgi:hypothetical protein
MIYGTHEQSHLKQKLQQLLKPLTPDYDNRYVWFTRNIHNEIKSEKQNQEQLRKNNFNGFFYHKDPAVKSKKLFTK